MVDHQDLSDPKVQEAVVEAAIQKGRLAWIIIIVLLIIGSYALLVWSMSTWKFSIRL